MRRAATAVLVPFSIAASLAGCSAIADLDAHQQNLEWVQIQEPFFYLKPDDHEGRMLMGTVKAEGSCMTVVADSVPFVPVFNQGDRRPFGFKDGDEVSLKGKQGSQVSTAGGREGYEVPESCLGVENGMLYYAVPEE